MSYKIIISIISVVLLVFVASLVVIEISHEKSPTITNTNSQNITPQETPQPTCFIGGCSNQICSDQPGTVSTCEYTEAYACYKTATCERQQNGQCGWTQTVELTSCLQGK